MVIPFPTSSSRDNSHSWYHDGVLYVLEYSQSVWVLSADGVPLRDLYGFPLTFRMWHDGKEYANVVLGHKI